jgi:hypothetical protein
MLKIAIFALLWSTASALQTPNNPFSALFQGFASASSSKPVSIVICPAQFCVPDDYNVLLENLKKELGEDRIGTCRVAPLPRTEWIKVAKSLPTKDYLDGALKNHKTLNWYFDAIEVALEEIFEEEGPDANICFIGHSIGGWVTRAFLGGLSKSSSPVAQLAQKQCSSFITLGTPHSSPDDALVDQTRGLLKEVEDTEACSSQALTSRGIAVTCVGSASLKGTFFTTNIEEFVAATSYFPLLGRLDDSVRGDGIIPTDLAFMEAPARSVELDVCGETGDQIRHAHVFPTPWSLLDGYAASIPLPFTWYGSESVIGEWAQYVK